MHEQIPATRRAPRDPAEASLENTTDAETSATDRVAADASGGGAVPVAGSAHGEAPESTASAGVEGATAPGARTPASAP
ncbi:hypothetical protein HR12_24315, partial [Microbacterium sp. SUBG005]